MQKQKYIYDEEQSWQRCESLTNVFHVGGLNVMSEFDGVWSGLALKC